MVRVARRRRPPAARGAGADLLRRRACLDRGGLSRGGLLDGPFFERYRGGAKAREGSYVPGGPDGAWTRLVRATARVQEEVELDGRAVPTARSPPTGPAASRSNGAAAAWERSAGSGAASTTRDASSARSSTASNARAALTLRRRRRFSEGRSARARRRPSIGCARKPADRRGERTAARGLLSQQSRRHARQLLTLALLASGPDAQALRRELDAVAARIEQLKARRLAGESVQGELNALLVRSQELAEELERARPNRRLAGRAASGDPDRERADELRDAGGDAPRRGRPAGGCGRRAGGPHRRRAPGRAPPSAALPASAHRARTDPRRRITTTGNARCPVVPTPALARLVEQRARLVAQIGALRAEASRLESERTRSRE